MIEMTKNLLSNGARAAAIAALCGLSLAPASAQADRYGQVIGNDMSKCGSGAGPAVRVRIDGLRSGSGNLFVRTYRASRSDWLKSKRYLSRLDASPRAGSMTVCIPVPSAGNYAIAVQHDINGNRETDFSTDGAGMSNNPTIGSFLGIPRPPSVDKAGFYAGPGVTNLTIKMRYKD
ncbi:MAG: DUF2141 domain-containing protein [Erythrobacter sp.]|nr:DUF2141 domain-containing protein [Erythrobacter sp.]NCQ64406.1 DUF2141 domain-containing protein [Alphaproteobacteria bacterium]